MNICKSAVYRSFPEHTKPVSYISFVIRSLLLLKNCQTEPCSLSIILKLILVIMESWYKMHPFALANQVLGISNIYIYIVFELQCVLEGRVKYFLDGQIISKKRCILEQKFRNLLFQRRLHGQHSYSGVLLDVHGPSCIAFTWVIPWFQSFPNSYCTGSCMSYLSLCSCFDLLISIQVLKRFVLCAKEKVTEVSSGYLIALWCSRTYLKLLNKYK